MAITSASAKLTAVSGIVTVRPGSRIFQKESAMSSRSCSFMLRDSSSFVLPQGSGESSITSSTVRTSPAAA